MLYISHRHRDKNRISKAIAKQYKTLWKFIQVCSFKKECDGTYKSNVQILIHKMHDIT